MPLLIASTWHWCMYAFTLMFIDDDELFGDGIQNWFDYFPVWHTMPLLAASSWHWCMYAFTLVFIDNDGINKACLFVLIYKLLVQDGIQNWFEWFSQYALSCSCWQHHHDSVVCMHLHWCSLTMTTLGIRSSLDIKWLFLFLKEFLTLSQIWFLNIFIFYELTIPLILILHAVTIALLAYKWTTCFCHEHHYWKLRLTP